MAILKVGVGILLLLAVLLDTFETVVLPRTVTRRLRLTKLFYVTLGTVWTGLARRLRSDDRRESWLVAFGPLSLLLLMGVWAAALTFSFALIQSGLGTPLNGPSGPDNSPSFGTYLYMSGATFFTVGFGDVTAHSPGGRTLAILEAGVGFGFLALVISYLPILYQSFSRREVTISMLDARAGSPPTAGELLYRYGRNQNIDALVRLLAEWERAAAELLESYLSYPVLAYYRSQHDKESWLAALTAILDTCALIRIGFQSDPVWQKELRWQAQLTFAIARHAVIDLSLILNLPPKPPMQDRLPPEAWRRLCQRLVEGGMPLCDDDASQTQLTAVRQQYEPYVAALAERLFLALPPWTPDPDAVDNWQTSAWDNRHHL